MTLKKIDWFSVFIWSVLAFAIALILFIVVGLFMGFVTPTDFGGPRRQCESLGGLFYPGSFGADNCVFPPGVDGS